MALMYCLIMPGTPPGYCTHLVALMYWLIMPATPPGYRSCTVPHWESSRARAGVLISQWACWRIQHSSSVACSQHSTASQVSVSWGSSGRTVRSGYSRAPGSATSAHACSSSRVRYREDGGKTHGAVAG